MIEYIDHLGIAVKSIEESLPYYERTLGLKCEAIEEVASQKVKTAFFKVGQTYLELLEPTSPESPVAKFLEKNGEGIHHVAFHTKDVAAALQRSKESGVRLVNETPVPGAHGKQVAFLHPKSTHGVLTEFCMNAPATHPEMEKNNAD